MNANYRNFALWVIIFLLVLALVTLFQSPGQKAPSSEITFSQLLSDADAGNVRDVTIAGPEITGHMKDGRSFQTYSPNDPELVQTMCDPELLLRGQRHPLPLHAVAEGRVVQLDRGHREIQS